MIAARTSCHNAALACLVAAAALLASAGGAGASEAAAQTVRMTIAEASVFNLPATPIVLASPVALRASGVRAEASLVSRYTIIGSSRESRILTANWGDGDRAPAGCRLRLRIRPAVPPSPAQAEGIIVSSKAQRVLAISGSSSTGMGPTGGAIVKYTLETGNGTMIKPGEHQAVTVTLTLLDPS